MRTPNRNRCRSGIIAAGIILLSIFGSATALSAEYRVLSNDSAYEAMIEINDAEEYFFFEQGMLGERIPQQVTGIHVTGRNGVVQFEETGNSRITFPRGNYTIRYEGTIRDNFLHAEYNEPYDVTVHLPPEFDVQNPFLGQLSPGGEVIEQNGSVSIHWNDVYMMECRFYDDVRERALFIFGTFWISLCIIFIVPYFILEFRKRR